MERGRDRGKEGEREKGRERGKEGERERRGRGGRRVGERGREGRNTCYSNACKHAHAYMYIHVVFSLHANA